MHHYPEGWVLSLGVILIGPVSQSINYVRTRPSHTITLSDNVTPSLSLPCTDF